MGQVSHAFLGEETWLNLYKTIDEWYEQIDNQNFEFELSWADDSIKNKVNTLINQYYELSWWELKNCIEKDLAPSHIISIATWNTQVLFEKMWNNCKSSKNAVDSNILNTVQKIIQEHYQETKNIAAEKTRQIQKIWSVWLYTDGILENSSFDLIDDIEKIDSIIFTQKIEYFWEEYEDLNKLFEDQQSDKKETINNNATDPEVLNENNWESSSNQNNNWNSNNSENNINLNILSSFNQDNSYFWASSNYVCVDDKSDHWFNPELIDQILDPKDSSSQNTSGNQWTNNWNPNNSGNNTWNSWNSNSSSSSEEKKKAETINGNYVKLNDNAVWPCTDFFCITVDFVVHQHQLLGWWPNITIEYLIDRSNQHLRKFANASLAPAKMTTQNFELWLKDLNLSDMFHMSFQVSTKPVPILTLENKLEKPWDTSTEKKWNPDDFSSNTLLQKYYKAYNLDYERRNDITIFTKQQEEYKTLLNSAGLWIDKVSVKQKTLNDYLNKNTLLANQISNSVYKKVTIDTLWDFGRQFTELDNFTTSIRDYTQSLSNLIEAMIKIPIDW